MLQFVPRVSNVQPNILLHMIDIQQKNPQHHHLALVISPLKALMHDQVTALVQKGVDARSIQRKVDMAADDITGKQ